MRHDGRQLQIESLEQNERNATVVRIGPVFRFGEGLGCDRLIPYDPQSFSVVMGEQFLPSGITATV
jgi:hypothetical protein